MLVESVSILAILLCILIIFVRSGHKLAALGALPLLMVPAVHLLAFGLSFAISRIVPAIPRPVMIAFSDIAAVALSGLLIHFQGAKIPARRPRRLYITLICGYNILLGCLYVYRTLEPILHS